MCIFKYYNIMHCSGDFYPIMSLFSSLGSSLGFQWSFLPNVASRGDLILPAAVQVDYRASCFCHHRLVDVGHVCSICLSSELNWPYSDIIIIQLLVVLFYLFSLLSIHSYLLHVPVSFT